MQLLRIRRLSAALPVFSIVVAALPLGIADAGQKLVAGLNELEIVDPGLREDGVPAIEFKDSPHGIEVEIRPTVHVHRYYYNGDKAYQAPFRHGGPTIVVANHPRTGKRLYIDVNLPPGAPLVSYTKRRITYTFPERRVIIAFSHCHNDKVTVHYRGGRRIGPKPEEVKTRHKLHQALKDAYETRKKLVVGAAATVSDLAGNAVKMSTEVLNALPGVQTLQGAGDQLRERANLETLRQSGIQRAKEATKFVRTNR